LNDDATIAARITGDFEPANDAGAKQVTVVQPVLLAHVVAQPLQVVFGQQLAGEETRPDNSLGHARTAACTTATARGSGSRSASTAATT
jgi:hypothetical protein